MTRRAVGGWRELVDDLSMPSLLPRTWARVSGDARFGVGTAVSCPFFQAGRCAFLHAVLPAGPAPEWELLQHRVLARGTTENDMASLLRPWILQVNPRTIRVFDPYVAMLRTNGWAGRGLHPMETEDELLLHAAEHGLASCTNLWLVE